MKLCHFDANQAGAVVGEKVYPIGETLVKAGHLRFGYSMLDVVDVLANQPGAMKCARDSLQEGSPLALGSVRLLAPPLESAFDLGGGVKL